MITVLGANGNTGKVVAERLLERGKKVRVVGRSKEKLEGLAKKGADVRVGDVLDAKFLTEAFRGSEGVYTLLPPNFGAPDFRKYQDEVGTATASAVRDAGVKRVVLLSSIGADKTAGTGPIAGVAHQEQRLKNLGVDVLALRPGLFMENFFMNLGLIKQQGINGGAIRPDLSFPMISTHDIAMAAAKALEEGFTGFSTRELHGAKNYTQAEATSILGARIGKPDLKYVQFAYDDFKNALLGMGASASVAGLYVEMSKAFNEGHVVPLEQRSEANTTPTKFEDFAEILAGAYRNS